MDTIGNTLNTTSAGWVLVVDDDPIARTIHRNVLGTWFDVTTADSGEAALAACDARLPDLVVLDIGMPGLDGYETCRRLRGMGEVPVIFATMDLLPEHQLMAYDAGGSDLVVKPVNHEILMRKAMLAIRERQARAGLAEERDSLQKMAMGFLSSVGETGALLRFTRAGQACRSHAALADLLMETAREFGVDCSVLVRHAGGPTVATTRGGAPSPLERSILDNSSDLGRVFQFKRRLAVNYERVAIVVDNMPEEAQTPELAGRLRDNIVVLAEICEALCENVDMRLESMERAERLQLALAGAATSVGRLRERYFVMLGDARLLLQDLVDKVERSYSWIGTTQAQEAAIDDAMDQSIQRILLLLAEGNDFDQAFDQVLEALRGGHAADAAELF